MEHLLSFSIFAAKYLLAPILTFAIGNYIQYRRYSRKLITDFNNRLYSNVIIYVNRAWAGCDEFMRLTKPLVSKAKPSVEVSPELFNGLLFNIRLALDGMQKHIDLNELDNILYSNLASKIKQAAVQLQDWIDSDSGIITREIAELMIKKLYPALETTKKCLITDIHGWRLPI